MDTPALDAAKLAQLDQNALRLIEAALRADTQRWEHDDLAAPSPNALADTVPLPLMDLAALDFSALEGQAEHGEAPQAPSPEALQQALAALPAELSPLSGPLDDAAFAPWLALYQRGDVRVVDAVTLVRQWALSREADGA
ncbi:MAG: hypothetical protein ACK5QH_14260 [Rubrivivax sp.]